MTAALDLRPAWRRDDPVLKADALAFWERHKFLPPTASRQEYAAELCMVAYLDGEVAGVSAAKLGFLAPVRSRMAFYRCAIHPDRRANFVLPQITEASRLLLLDWARVNPAEKVKGMAAVIEGPFEIMKRAPIWRHGGLRLGLIGHMPDGRQIRVAWFPGARLEPGAV